LVTLRLFLEKRFKMAQAEKQQRMSTDEYSKKLEKLGIRRVHDPGGGVSFLSWRRGSTRSKPKQKAHPN
jgi:hypothetical protein